MLKSRFLICERSCVQFLSPEEWVDVLGVDQSLHDLVAEFKAKVAILGGLFVAGCQKEESLRCLMSALPISISNPRQKPVKEASGR